MKRSILAALLTATLAPLFLSAQTQSAADLQAPLRIESRAVLLDVIVTGPDGQPVTGLPRQAFTVSERGKAQAISFFEEHRNADHPAKAVEFPKLPPNVFSNFSPYPAPPVVNVVLLDSLNTRMENQSFIHAQCLKFLRSAKPGTRMAIFTMSLGLHYVQGFTEDPAVLVAALQNKKNNEVQTSALLKGQDEANAQQNLLSMMSAEEPGGRGSVASPDAVASLRRFLQENDDSRSIDRARLTLENLQRLGRFLNGFPGRKNVIWFSESFPILFSGVQDQGVSGETAATMAGLAAARVALYPVDAGGAAPLDLYKAETNPNAGVESFPALMTSQGTQNIAAADMGRNSAQELEKTLAEQTGGKAFTNSNGFAQILSSVTSSSAHFYTLSYTPTDTNMDDRYRPIEVKVQGGDYKLSYRRGYFAADADLPGSAMFMRDRAVQELAAKNSGGVDPLLPFMDLGMPQSEQILYEISAQTSPANGAASPSVDFKHTQTHYTLEFSVLLKDLGLHLDPDGRHQDTLTVSILAYDRYGNIVARKDHLVALDIKPDVYAIYQNTGLKLHAEINVPKGDYWLRTGIYDHATHHVGTMEFPLDSVKPTETAAR